MWGCWQEHWWKEVTFWRLVSSEIIWKYRLCWLLYNLEGTIPKEAHHTWSNCWFHGLYPCLWINGVASEGTRWMVQVVIEKPILNSPFEEPESHFHFSPCSRIGSIPWGWGSIALSGIAIASMSEIHSALSDFGSPAGVVAGEVRIENDERYQP